MIVAWPGATGGAVTATAAASVAVAGSVVLGAASFGSAVVGIAASVGVVSGAGVTLGVGETVVSGSLLIAIPLAMLAGLLSFGSPCVLPLVPAYLSYVTGLTGVGLAEPGSGPERHGADTGRGGSPIHPGEVGSVLAAAPTPTPVSTEIETSAVGTSGVAGASTIAGAPGVGVARRPSVHSRGRIVAGTLGFVLGFSAVFVSYGALFGGLGAALLEHQERITRVLGAVVIVLGLGFLGLIPALQREARLHRRPARGIWGAPLLGMLFGLGWTPCIGPTLAAVQGLAFSEGSALRGAILSLAYCLGLGLPFLVVGLAMQRGLGALAWARRNARGIQVVGGVCLILLGVLMVSGLWGSAMNGLRGLIGGWEVPL